MQTPIFSDMFLEWMAAIRLIRRKIYGFDLISSLELYEKNYGSKAISCLDFVRRELLAGDTALQSDSQAVSGQA